MILMLFGGLYCSDLMAQTVSVTGNVKAASGEVLPGAYVIIKGTTAGVMTDQDGNFTLSNVPSDAILTISFMGMKSQEIPVEGKTIINVILEDDAVLLSDEIVVIGYGTAKKKDLTGAVTSLDSKKIIERQNTQVASALQGAMSGVTVTRSSSTPGAGATIRVRGITSIQESDPLVIVDGVPVNSINDVNPADIDNLTVLKDAAAASIYGARAAAGVVLITTQRGKKDGMSIDYSYNLSMDMPTAMPDYADAVTYMKVLNERNWNDTPAGGEYTVYDEDLINSYWSLNKTNPDLYPNTDWVDLCLKKYALRNTHQLGITSGTEKSRTKLSIGYDDVEGLYKANSSWNRVTIRINNDIKLKKWLSVAADLNLRKAEEVVPAFSPALRMRYAAPVYAGIYTDGRLAGGKDGENPYGKMMYGGNDKTSAYRAAGKFSVDVTPIEDLVFTGVFAPTYNFTKVKAFNVQVPYYTAWDDYSSTALLDGTNTTDLTETRNDNYSFTTQFFANYSKKIKNHNLSAMAGFESYYHFYENLWTSRGEYDLPYYPYLTAGPSTLIDNDGDAAEDAYNSFFGRLMYNYRNKYYVQANARYDGSSRFSEDYRWGFFPSVSAGWTISEESFMKDIVWLSSLKLRGSWGQLGNERIGNYLYSSNVAFNSATLYVGNTVTPVQGASSYIYSIPDITWETTETTDFGFDMALLNSRLRIAADYYIKKTKDMLLNLDIPILLGYEAPNQNAGTMTTNGWDLEVGWTDDIDGFHYSVSVNVSDYKSVMGEMEDTYELSDSKMTREGSEYKQWYGYQSDGIYQSDADLIGSPLLAAIGAGDIRYKDISGPDGTPDGQVDATYDRVLLKGSLPRYNFGADISLGYKGFDFLLSLQGVGKKTSLLSDEMVEPIRGDWYNVPQMIVGKYWSNYNTPEQNLAAKYPRVSRNSISNNYAVSDFWMINGAYLRIKNITLGYSFPTLDLDKLGVEKLRIYVSLQDYFTFSHYPTGWDPEVSSTGYPITKSAVFGLSVKF